MSRKAHTFPIHSGFAEKDNIIITQNAVHITIAATFIEAIKHNFTAKHTKPPRSASADFTLHVLHVLQVITNKSTSYILSEDGDAHLSISLSLNLSSVPI